MAEKKEKKYVSDDARLMAEWDFEKNEGVSPSEVTIGSNKKVWWKCSKGHEWETAISKRKIGRNCPICQGVKILPGYNDLSTTHPELIREWDYEKNKDVSPLNVGKGSEKRVWWKCKYGHSWSSVIYSRVAGVGCPLCSKERQSSYPEKAIYFYVRKMFPDAVAGYKSDELRAFELDIYIPAFRIAIEYDGERWHQDLDRDIEKNNICKDLSIQLIRVREPKCPHIFDDYSKIITMQSKKSGLDKTIYKVLDALQLITGIVYTFRVDLIKDNIAIMELLDASEKENSLTVLHPELLPEWDYERNGTVLPSAVSSGSDKKVWWICNQMHSYQASISSRVRGRGCPYCSGKKVLKGYNDFASKCPELLQEWDYTKNHISPYEVPYGTDKKFWWKCDKGHSYSASINNKRAGAKCPFCSGKRVLIGFNDIVTTHPMVVTEWAYELNDVQPTEISAGSHKKVWWKCTKCGNEWIAPVYNRISGHNCPVCARKYGGRRRTEV